MQDFTLDGIGSISGGNYKTLTVDGVADCSGDISAEDLRVVGIFNCKNKVEAQHFYSEGVCNFKGGIKAKKLEVTGIVNLSRGSVEADEILCEGVINAKGQISADKIHANGYINANEIVGDDIRIYSRTGFIGGLFTFAKQSRIKLIEATTVHLSGVRGDEVNGQDIIIGPKCKIDRVDCSGTLSIDPTAMVGTITGDYTKKE